MNSNKILLLLLILIIFAASLTTAAKVPAETEQEGWWLPSTGRFNGHWDLGMGAHFWDDNFDLRNLQLRTNVDLGPGLRLNSILRSN